MQHANIELIFYEDLPLASLPLKEYERIGNATLVGSFYAAVEARISVRERIGKSPAATSDPSILPKSDEIGQLLIRGSFLPNRLTLDALQKKGSLAQPAPTDVWCSTGVVGYLDEQSRFWLTQRIVI
jgi:hypothetical protein